MFNIVAYIRFVEGYSWYLAYGYWSFDCDVLLKLLV
jgi:hypothetical protein